jgi:hypothetical protein
MVAECSHDQVVRLANLFGLLAATGKATCAGALPPEPVDTWHREIRALWNATALWDAIAGNDEAELRLALPQHQAAKGKELFRRAREHLGRRVTEKIAGQFELIAPPDEGPSQFVIRYRPLRLINAIWQRFAEETADVIVCVRCPAPKCGRWFPRNTGRSDRDYCCDACG